MGRYQRDSIRDLRRLPLFLSLSEVGSLGFTLVEGVVARPSTKMKSQSRPDALSRRTRSRVTC